jgi:hypothetical protein
MTRGLCSNCLGWILFAGALVLNLLAAGRVDKRCGNADPTDSLANAYQGMRISEDGVN